MDSQTHDKASIIERLQGEKLSADSSLQKLEVEHAELQKTNERQRVDLEQRVAELEQLQEKCEEMQQTLQKVGERIKNIGCSLL